MLTSDLDGYLRNIISENKLKICREACVSALTEKTVYEQSIGHQARDTEHTVKNKS